MILIRGTSARRDVLGDQLNSHEDRFLTSSCGVWATDGAPLTESEEVSLKLSSAGKRVSGRFSWRGRQYWLLGRRETDMFLSGTYIDEQAGNTFHGAFQLSIYPNEERMRGRWMGFNASNVIIEGPWEWRRGKVATFPHEIATAPNDR